MFWFTQIADLPKDLADEAKMIYLIQDIGLYASYALAGVGALCLLLGIAFIFCGCGKKQEKPQVIIINENLKKS